MITNLETKGILWKSTLARIDSEIEKCCQAFNQEIFMIEEEGRKVKEILFDESTVKRLFHSEELKLIQFCSLFMSPNLRFIMDKHVTG
jgi:hypothetical protein